MKAVELLSANLDQLQANYDALLRIASQVASGEIHAARLSVDLQARTWAVRDKGEYEAEILEALANSRRRDDWRAMPHGVTLTPSVRMEDLETLGTNGE